MNSNTRKKLRVLFKAALLGVVFSLGLSLYVRNYFQGKNGIFWDLLFMIPTLILGSIIGIANTPQENSFVFMVIANVLVITFTFIAFAFFWQFIVKGNHENKK